MSTIRHFSGYLSTLASLVGIPTDRITPELAGVFTTLFNSAIQDQWIDGPWLDVCPRGEARFVGDRLSYPNNLTASSYWTGTAVTLTANTVQNPCDGSATSSQIMETSANSAHKVVQNVTTFYPSIEYAASCYARPNGRGFIQISCFDGVGTYSAFFNIQTGAVVSTSNTDSAQFSQQPNGFWLCRITFTASASATTSGTYTVSLSTDGSTLSYAGDATKGAYIWGNVVQQMSNVPLNDSLLPWAQLGENEIDSIFNVWASSPSATNLPVQLTYNINPDGVQIINATPVAFNYYVNGVAQQSIFGAVPANPVFIYYRKVCPNFQGGEFDATATYIADQQIYFTNAIGNGDFYKCLVATTPGQSPDTTPGSWQLLAIYDPFYQYSTYRAYADWLISDGQMDKSMAARAIADRQLDEEFDKRERQMGDVFPMKVQTHLTSQQRWY